MSSASDSLTARPGRTKMGRVNRVPMGRQLTDRVRRAVELYQRIHDAAARVELYRLLSIMAPSETNAYYATIERLRRKA